jgi:pyruvate formate lyase activating enzyme
VLENAFKLAKEELHYVYIGNISAVDARTGYNRTNCPDCGQVLVERAGFAARVTGVDQGRCSNCGREVDLVLPTEGDEER